MIPVANRQSLDMARRCKELPNIHQIKSTIHCLGINLTNIRVLWDHIWLNSYRFLTSVLRELWSDRAIPCFIPWLDVPYSWIGRSLSNWAFWFPSVLRVQHVTTHYFIPHYIDVIMTTMLSQITSLTVVYSIVYSGADQRKHQSSVSLAFVSSNST